MSSKNIALVGSLFVLSALATNACRAQINPIGAAGLYSTERIKIQLQSAKQKLHLVQEQYKAGTITAGTVEDAQSEVAKLEVDLREAEKGEEQRNLINRLSKPVTIDLKNATLDQAAQSISKAADVPIRVASTIRSGPKVTLSAADVSLRNVLEQLARTLSLRIAPGANGGIELQPWPQMEVNGQRYILADPSPWSAEWGNDFLVAQPSQAVWMW